ncbi:MAG: ribosome silencing factor, partial [Clostridiales bacterium]|nr:ribosome silencing factor [Clostridiales bacterium]
SNSWVLLDYGSVIIHVFTSDAREFYNLDRLWQDGEIVDISDIQK